MIASAIFYCYIISLFSSLCFISHQFLLLCTIPGRLFCYLLFFLVPKMGKKKSLSEVQRAQIVALHCQNLSERQISAQMGCSKTAVHQAIAKYQQDDSYTDKKRTGRPRVITAREDNVMRRIVVRSPTSSMKKIRAELLRRGRRISHITVSRGLSTVFNMKS